MSDMRIVVAGAGGRMGRTLVKAVAETSGLVLAGAIEQSDSRFLKHDAGELAGLGKNGIALTADAASALSNADGLIDFTVPAASRDLVARTAERGIVHIMGTTGFSQDDEAAIKAASAKAVIVKGTVPDTDQRDRLARVVAASSVSDCTLQWDVTVEGVLPPDSADGRGRSPVTGTSADSRHQSRHQLDVK